MEALNGLTSGNPWKQQQAFDWWRGISKAAAREPSAAAVVG
jgi:hypothetical protein